MAFIILHADKTTFKQGLLSYKFRLTGVQPIATTPSKVVISKKVQVLQKIGWRTEAVILAADGLSGAESYCQG